VETRKKNVGQIVELVLKAVGLAMGVAAVVLSVLNVADVETTVLLLGIGLFGTAVGNFDKGSSSEQTS